MQSYVEQFIGSGEDPERIIEQAVEDMNTDLVKLRQTAAQVLFIASSLCNIMRDFFGVVN